MVPPYQENSDGLLEVVMLISGEHRKRNIPGAAFRKGAENFLKKAGLISPSLSSPGNSIRHWTPGRWVVGVRVANPSFPHHSLDPVDGFIA